MSTILIGVVGPCSAGKSSLVEGLKKHGFFARAIAQEHSYVQDMWKRITNPDILIFLDVSYPLTIERLNLNWTESEYRIQSRRLDHARNCADFYLCTDKFSVEKVLDIVLNFISNIRI